MASKSKRAEKKEINPYIRHRRFHISIVFQGPGNESYAEMDYQLESIKCQTAPDHSGQKSDAACSSEKGSTKLDIRSNRGRLLISIVIKRGAKKCPF